MAGDVVEASCECAAGHSIQAHCKHVTVVLIALEVVKESGEVKVEKACTGKLQKWHRPSKKWFGTPIKAKDMKVCKKGQLKKTCLAKQFPKTEADQAMEIEEYNCSFRNVLINAGLNLDMSMKQLLEPANPYAVDWDHCYTDKNYRVERLLDTLHLQNISLDNIQMFEEKTRNQSNSRLWHQLRKVRITGSMMHSICQDIDTDRGNKLAKSILYPKKLNNNIKPIRHGRTYEKIAIKKLDELSSNHLKVQECGIFISKEYPFIAASPDGLLAELTVVEVKCPYTSRNQEINEVTVPYLFKIAENKYGLKKEHPYYYQIQTELLVTGRKFCDFIVYTFKDFQRITVDRDKDLIEKIEESSKDFFAKFLKPAIINKYIYRNYEEWIAVPDH